MVVNAQVTRKPQSETQAARQLQNLRNEIRDLSSEQKKSEDARHQAIRLLRDADVQVSTASRALRLIEIDIAQQESELKRLQAQANVLELRLDQQRLQLAALLRSAYVLGRHEQLKLLLAQDQMRDLSRVLVYQRYIQNDRKTRVEQLLRELSGLATVMTTIRDKKSSLEQSRAQQQARLAALDAERTERAKVLQQIDRQFSSRAERITMLGRDEKHTQQFIQRLQGVLADIPSSIEDSRPFSTRKGQLSKPLSGTVLTGFGAKFADGRRSEGILIAGTPGAPVRAIAAGRVAFSDWLKGYGLLLIMDHGDGWLSLYAGNDALLREVGDWVQSGEPIANVGSSGGQGRAALYFELRNKGQPVDPDSWWLR